MKERGGGQHCVTGKGGPSQADGNSLDVMGAIAQGVEAKCDLLTGYSQMVTEGVTAIARELDIGEKKIQRWRVAREKLYSAKNEVIKSALNRLPGDSIRQS